MLEEMISKLSDDDLKTCFDEIVEWRKQGYLPMEARVRTLWESYKELQSTYPIHMMTEPILFEIAKRSYQ
ncbi:hypothetical protein SAMN04487895_101657 [Paenibacillus sophorae]|uniref:Uncharacterized protein n=1 Tax=Paenibacillus sophorae TaxID=1333845 RepID=A0A1H8GVR2_9BACL|nr:hypothetical protein [Paenibacillus sophorae]QWU14354.1 hypothetical protein KP014_20830 [Paenibacillus sophorae]SEN47900.1 hypothetical protein SAMN04487895_101657 [Paenibacillus sophorae]